MKKEHYVGLYALALSATTLVAADGTQRIVAVGDIHGDFNQFVQVLKDADLVDQNCSWQSCNWLGGKSILVQTGDVPDRGPDTKAVMDLLMSLERQAGDAGGKVHALIGNHEAMNVLGELRYVCQEELAAFKHPRSPGNHVCTKTGGQPKRHTGYKEHRKEFHPKKGKYGKWIVSHDSIVKAGDSLFLHGGLSRNYAQTSLPKLNRKIQQQLRSGSQQPLQGDKGPLIYRRLRHCPSHLNEVLTAHGAERIVVGHTGAEDGQSLRSFCDGRVVEIDVGLSRAYHNGLGARACLVIENGVAYALENGIKRKL